MPHRRSITIVALTAAILACGLIAYLVSSRTAPEASFQGHSASYWLRAVHGIPGQQPQALEAFRQMGASAHPVLVAAFEGREHIFAKIRRYVYRWLPPKIQRRFAQPEDLRELRNAAFLVLLNTHSRDIVPKLLPLLAKPDSELRLAVLAAVENLIGPPDAGQVSFLRLAADDPSARIRARALLCLSKLGRSAASAAPTALRLCADTNITVRIYAAVAAWNITGQTNVAVAALEGIMSQSQDGELRHWAARYLLGMTRPDSMMITTFINSLTSRSTGVRISACACLAQIGPPAAAAIPALRETLDDPEVEVRRRAELALAKIDPPAAATLAP